MLGFFTDPHPEELLYSACARFAVRAKYPNKNTVLKNLFGNERVAAVVDLPNRIDNLIEALVPGHLHTADSLIEKNTLYPLYAPFLTVNKSKSVRNEMKGSGDNRIRSILGITSSGIELPSRLRFCPVCVNEDREKYQETYWHRIHQVTGVDVCPIHAVFLVPSTAAWQENIRSSSVFLSAEDHVYSATAVTLDPNNQRHSIKLNLARNAAWLLKWRGPYVGTHELRDRYHNLLLARGYAHYNGDVKTTKLFQDLTDFYQHDFLEELQCSMGPPPHCWLTRLLLKDKVDVAQHPLRHLLLITFLGRTSEQVFSSFVAYKPFGEGPWPCLNKASSHYGKKLVTKCVVTASLVKGSPGRPRGTFRCECGFTYSRVGPDKSENDLVRFNSVKDYGRVWEQKLRDLWRNPSVPFVRMAEELGFGEATIIRRAVYLGLPYPRDGRGKPVDKRSLPRHYRNLQEPPQQVLKSRRRQWLDLRKANPEASRKRLLELAPYLHFWLRQHDRKWFDAHSPSHRQYVRVGQTVNWAAIDPELSGKVMATASRIKGLVGKPTRVSMDAVIKEVGHKVWLESRQDKLPLTAKALDECVETLETFQLRKVRWATDYFLNEGICPTRSRFLVTASLRNGTSKRPPVQRAIRAALLELRRSEG